MNNTINLSEKLFHLQWLLGRKQLRNHMEYGPYADPSRGQGRVLTLLKMQPEISTRELSYLLGIRQQSLNELVNKLEKKEYVMREHSASDRRVMLVKLTEKGKAQQQQETDYSDIFSCLSEEEQTAMADYLDRITTALETQLGIRDDEKPEDEQFVTESGKLYGCGYGERFHRGFDHGGHGNHGGHGARCGEHRGHGKDGRNGCNGRKGSAPDCELGRDKKEKDAEDERS